MDSRTPIRIFLSDDHPFVRRGLRNILESAGKYEVCGEAGDGNLTLELAMQLRPDVVITDISMSPPNGLEVAAQLRQAVPKTKILIMTMHDSEEMLRAAMRAGATGYLLKSDPEELLGIALQCLEEGKCFVSPAFSPQFAKQLVAEVLRKENQPVSSSGNT
jgi:DNA-binding NarL/FixJ family response regulator